MGKEQPNERRDCGRRRRAFWQTTAAIRTVGSAEWLAGPPTVGTLVVLVPTHIPGLKGNTPAGKPDDAIGYAAEGAGFFGAQYDPANFPLSKELQLLGLSEQAWADILTSLREGKARLALASGSPKRSQGQTKIILSASGPSLHIPSTARAKRRWSCCR